MKVKFTINENKVLEKAELTDDKGAVITHGVRGAGVEDFDSSLLTDAVIPNGVTCIGDGAFSGCDWLSGVVIPDSVTSIGNRAFYDCYSLTKITIPESMYSPCTKQTGIPTFSGSPRAAARNGCTTP